MKVRIPNGHTLWQTLNENGIILNQPCGGNGNCGRCMVDIEGIGRVKSCQFDIPGEYQVSLLPQMEYDVISDNHEPLEGYAAVDVGTTTVAIKYNHNNQQKQVGFVNPQRKFGADVMTRIKQAGEGHETEMQQSLWAEINNHLPVGLKLVISANTTMQHIMRGLSCQGLGVAPFTPVDTSLYIEESRTYLPGISTFVGADIVSGLYSLDILNRSKPILLIDLGTNGEMALGCRDRIIVTSAAAGPAFEGSDLAVKLHASGIMKLLHHMKNLQIIDEYGTLQDEYFDSGYPVPDSEGLCITQDDIRQLQMAKAAVRAGIEILIDRYGISGSEIDQVYLAGGMGYYLNPQDAQAIGLLPEGIERIQAAGNTSLAGAIKYAATENGDALRKIVAISQEIILADQPEFEELYIEKMNF